MPTRRESAARRRRGRNVGHSLDDVSLAAPGPIGLRRLAGLIARYAPHDGVFPLRLPGTYALRRGRITSEPVHATLGPSLCIVAQGAKVLMLGRDVFEYDPSRMLVFTVDLPVAGQVTRASRADPFLGFRLDLSAERVAELAARVYPQRVPASSESSGLFVGQTTDAIVGAAGRLLELMGQPEEVDLIGPLVVDEILIRLLRTPVGPRVAQIGRAESGVHRIGRAVSWIREHFAQPITVEDMAAAAGMRASSFHQRFKTVTTMSPLQYQKALRLHEARRLMLFHGLDAGGAAYRVGYLSASQFSREYTRLFGSAPTRDIARLRAEGFAPTAA